MQKKIIALAIAGLASSAAFADSSNVTLYGRADYGFINTSGASGGIVNSVTTNKLDDGLQGGSRIGLKGAEDLGNGMKAIFEVETGIYLDANTVGSDNSNGKAGKAGGLFGYNRHSYVGMTGGFGTVIGGRLDGVRYGIYNKYDAFAGGTVGNFTQMTNQTDRADNAIAYVSPDFSGFKFLYAHSTNVGATGLSYSPQGSNTNAESAGNVNDMVLNTFTGYYDNGPISLVLDHEQISTNKPSTSAHDATFKTSVVGGSYDFGVVKVGGVYDKLTYEVAGVNAIDYAAYFISLSAPLNAATTLKFTAGKVSDKMAADNSATKVGIGLDYAFSKRTNLYVDYGSISNSNNASNVISAAANAGAAPTTGSNLTGAVRGFDLGIAHKF